MSSAHLMIYKRLVKRIDNSKIGMNLIAYRHFGQQ